METQDWIMTDNQQYALREHQQDADAWLRRMFYYMGIEQGIYSAQNFGSGGSVFLNGWDDSMKGGTALWASHYGVTRFVLSPPHGHPLQRARDSMPGLDFTRLVVWGQNERGYDDGRFVALVAEMIERKARSVFRKIEQENYLRLCSVNNCVSHVWKPRASECIKIGDRFVCQRCSDMFSLAPPAPTVRPRKDQSEREKMSVSLRFDILARDGFRCAACGQRPTRENGVELDVRSLHIDHITPIARDGKTERGNLVTLCKDCNLGKSDKELSDELRAYFEAMTTG